MQGEKIGVFRINNKDKGKKRALTNMTAQGTSGTNGEPAFCR
jgi:hypothetical protein